MSCITPDGKLTESAKKILGATKDLSTPEEISKVTDIPLFRVRSSLRELGDAGLLEKIDGRFRRTVSGDEKLKG